MATEFQVTYDCADPGRQATFWAEALNYILQPPPEPFESWSAALEAWGIPPELHNERSAIVDPHGRGPRIFFQKVPEGKAAKNRVHLDLRVAPGLEGETRMDALEDRAQYLEKRGARRLYRVDPDGIDAGHITMADPEGNEFCLD